MDPLIQKTKIFSFQSNWGVFVFSLLLAWDTFIGFILSTNWGNLELAGIGVLIVFVIVTFVFTLIFFLVIKVLQKFLTSSKWDSYVLCPFTILSIIFIAFVIHRLGLDSIVIRNFFYPQPQMPLNP